jgi:hypothetical protein
MTWRWLPPLVDVVRREIRLTPIWLTTSALSSLAIGFVFVLIMAALP